MLRDNKGITLIALTITIIILLILAGITIGGGRESIKMTKSNKLLAELDMVQHACLERYTEYKLTGDISLLIGTEVNYAAVQGLAEELGINTLLSTNNYYRLTPSDLEKIGIQDANDTYIVNYQTGEVINETQKQITSGSGSNNNVLYKYTAVNEGYVQDGLVLHYDGVNNTGNGHSNTTTTWKDLSGNGNDGTLTGCTWGENYLDLDGVDDYVRKTGMTGTTDFTIEIVANDIEANGTNSYGSSFMINLWSSDVTDTSIHLWVDNRTSIAESNRNKPLFRILVPKLNEENYREVSGNRDLNCKGYYSISNGQSGLKYYSNGNSIGQNTDASFTNRVNINTINLDIGRWYNTSYFVKEKVYSFRIYNRALTDAEVLQNYNQDRIRFGL